MSPDMFANMYDSTAYQRPAISQFTIRSFRIFLKLMQLQDAILQYMVIKGCMSVQLNMPGLTSYLSAALYSSDTY